MRRFRRRCFDCWLLTGAWACLWLEAVTVTGNVVGVDWALICVANRRQLDRHTVLG